MKTFLIAMLLATATAAILTPVIARIAFRYGRLDFPDGWRKEHLRAVPRVGGIAVLVAILVPIAGLAMYSNDVSRLLYAKPDLVLAFAIGACGIAAIGMYDDIAGASPRTKLAGQVLVATGAWLAGFQIETLFVPAIGLVELGTLSLPLTVLWVVGIVNALNLIDGLDGLASGVALFASFVLLTAAILNGSVLIAILLSAMIGALSGFLLFNFNPARIFLGDCGSMLLGYVLAIAAVWSNQKSATAAALLVPIVALGVPILDTALAICRRLYQRKSPFLADKEHLHHKLIAVGLTHRRAVIVLWTTSGIFALASMAMLGNDAVHTTIAVSAAGVVVVLLLKAVKIVNFPGLGRPPVPALRAQIRGHTRALRCARSRDDAWQQVLAVAHALNLEGAELAWHAPPDRPAVTFRYQRDPELKPSGGYGQRSDIVCYDKTLGQLVVMYPSIPPPSLTRFDLAVAVEMLVEALVDFGHRDLLVAHHVPEKTIALAPHRERARSRT